MPASPSWMPPHSVLFAIALCLMMVAGDVFAEAVPRIGNPAKLAFYSFLPMSLPGLEPGCRRRVATAARERTEDRRQPSFPRAARPPARRRL